MLLISGELEVEDLISLAGDLLFIVVAEGFNEGLVGLLTENVRLLLRLSLNVGFEFKGLLRYG